MLRLIRIVRPYSGYIMMVWIVAILIVSSTPHLPVLKIHTQKSDIRLDYFIHFCEYGFLALMTYLAFVGKDFKISFGRIVLITACLLLFAVLDELHQNFIPGRTVNPKDMASNFAGILAALIFCVPVFAKIHRILWNSEARP